MHQRTPGRWWLLSVAVLFVVQLVIVPLADGACCYFSAKNQDVTQPAQKVFITWDPIKKIETFTVQPKFEGNALDFGMVIPTPSQPKLHAMPRGFFKHLAIYGILKRREFPQSQLLYYGGFNGFNNFGGIAGFGGIGGGFGGGFAGPGMPAPRPPEIKVLDSGVVGSLDYKVIKAGRADDLYKWLKDHDYSYAGDEATLDFYIQKKWIFTVMKIDTMQMKKNKDGSYAGEVTPTRFTFHSGKLIYPLKITQLSVKDKTEALIYVQAPFKVDLPGAMSYQHTWVPMLQAASACTPGGLPGKGEQWLAAIKDQIPSLLKRNQQLGYNFVSGQRPQPNAKGITPTTMEWARRLTQTDIGILTGKVPYSETVPNVDFGFTVADVKNPRTCQAVLNIIRYRLALARKARPNGYLVRHAPKEEIKGLRHLAGHLQPGLFLTKMRKVFTRSEMNDDLLIVQAKMGDAVDTSEYLEALPTSPP